MKLKEFLLYVILFIKKVIFICTLIAPMFIVNSLFLKDIKSICFFIVIQFILYIIDVVFGYLSELFMEKHLEERKLNLIDTLIDKITKQSNDKFKYRDKYISWIINDMNILKYEYFKPKIEIFFLIFEIVIYLLGLIYFGVAFFIVNILGTLLITIYTSSKSKNYSNVNSDISKLSENKTKFITNLFDNIFTFWFSGDMKIFKEKNVEYNEVFLGKMKKVIKPLYIFLTQKNILLILIQTINIILAIYYIYKGKISLGAYSVIGSFSGYLTNTFNLIIQNYVSIKKSKEVLKRYDEELIGEKQGEVILSDIDTIEFKNIFFKDVYNNFNYTFEKNKKYLIIGESGCGKSTLMNLILKNIEDYTGDIYINNHKLEGINKYSIYKNIEYMNADNFIFYSTIDNNISMFDDEINKNKVNNILENLNLENRSEELTENGVSLGQKQRINLARVLYMDKPIIILDEATSNLDKNNRERIENMFLNLNKTIIFITHYYDEKFIKNFDEVLLLKRGGKYERHIVSK